MSKKILVIALTLLFASFIYGFTEAKEITAAKVSSYLVQNATIEGVEKPLEEQYKVKDLRGNLFHVQVGKDGGFMVFDPISYTYTEKSAKMISPYSFARKADYYYFGPMNYYEKIGDKFLSPGIETKFVSLNYVKS